MEVTHFVCPRCQQRAVRMPHTGDFEHDCFGSEVLANEDVLVIGDWEDFTGSDDVPSTQTSLTGQENTLQGTRAELEGQKEPGARTERGFPRNRFRTRRHIEHISASAFKKEGIPDVDVESRG